MNKPTTPKQLAAILKREYESADDYHESIETLQEAAFRYYEAQPFGNEVDGRSQIVLPDVQETIDGMLGVILKIMASGDRVVEFEATNEEDESKADDATAALDYMFMRKQDGYRVLNDFLLDGLQRKYGVLKAVCEEEEKVSRRWMVIQDEMEIGLIEQQGGEVEDVREQPDGTARVLVKTQRTEKTYNVVAIPTAEYRFSPRATHEDCADYQAHVRAVSRSDVVAMGFDRDQVYGLPAYSRDFDLHHESRKLDNFNSEESTPALEEVLLCEEYAHIDVDGDGIAEMVKCFRVENEILRWAGEPEVDELGQPMLDENGEPVMSEGEPAIETIDEQPFAVGCPFPRQHRLVGYSLADKNMDAQFLRSYFARQLIDGMAYANLPRPYVDMSQASDETLDDLLNPVAGGPVRGNGPGAVTNLQSNFNIGDSLQAMEWVSREKEARSGIGRASPTLDENTLNNQTATEFAGREGKAETMQEYIARNMAEAVARAFGKLYRLMRVEAEPFQIRVDGKYREVDPSQWPESMNMRVRVGLGAGGKEKRVMAFQMMREPLTMAAAEGLAGPEHLFKWFDQVARATGIGQGDDFMYDPNDPEVQAKMQQKGEEPDPAVLEAQGKLQLETAKAQANAQLDRDKVAAQIETQREKHLLDMEVAREKAALDNQLARDKAAAEIELAREKARAEIAMKVEMPDQRMGGSLAS